MAPARRADRSRVRGVRRVPLVVIMVGLVGAVIAVSIWTVHRAGREALQDFRATQARLAQDTSSALRVYLDRFDRDTRLLATLARGTRKQTIAVRAQDEVMLDAFSALATVVTHYRTIALFHPGRSPIVAVDPTEDRDVVAPALVEASAALAAKASASGKTTSAGPLTLHNGRSFYLYAVAVDEHEAVVVTSDAALMLEAVSRRPTGSHELVVVDPSGAAWLGCEERQRCRLLPPGSKETDELMRTIDEGSREDTVASRRGSRLGLPARVVVGADGPLASPLGVWSVAVLASAADIDVREGAFLRQLVFTSIGVATAMLTIGLLVLRQHATAATLGARLQAAEEVATLQRQLVRAEKLVTVGVLSAGIAHEIGTPLAVVRGRAEHMLERRGEARDGEDLRAIIGEIDRIASTIRQVLDFSREQPIEIGKTDARAAIDRAVEMLGWRLDGRRTPVVVEAPPNLPPIAVAADQLEQVVINLLMNASDASAPNSPIRVALARDEVRADRLSIKIVDRGAGIPPHQLNAVFDPYFTTKKRDEGTGLGLAIVWRIVSNHGGEISLRSAVGLGTVATLSWPIATAHALGGGIHV
jgi:signal transduction histidine kinase